MEPEVCIPPPHRDSKEVKKLTSAGRGIVRASTFGDGIPNGQKVKMATSDRPPRVSTTKGTKSIPASQKSDRWATSLHCTHTFRAWPGLDAAA